MALSMIANCWVIGQLKYRYKDPCIFMSLLLIDLNECMSSNGGCEQDCVNVLGSFHCKCFLGYYSDNDEGQLCKGYCVNLFYQLYFVE